MWCIRFAGCQAQQDFAHVYIGRSRKPYLAYAKVLDQGEELLDGLVFVEFWLGLVEEAPYHYGKICTEVLWWLTVIISYGLTHSQSPDIKFSYIGWFAQNKIGKDQKALKDDRRQRFVSKNGSSE